MAIMHLSVKTISRSAGRSATAAAAYRTGTLIRDERTGIEFDYTRKGGVEPDPMLILPPGAPDWATDGPVLWNRVEQHETRKNSTVAREVVLGLPCELDAEERRSLARSFGQTMVDRYQCVVQVCIHEPSEQGDDRNHHAHVLCSTRKLEPGGFTDKTRELDDMKSGHVIQLRQVWAGMVNAELERKEIGERISPLSNLDRGMEELPTIHEGVAARAIAVRGEYSDRCAYNDEIRATKPTASERLGKVWEATKTELARCKQELQEFFKEVAACQARERAEQAAAREVERVVEEAAKRAEAEAKRIAEEATKGAAAARAREAKAAEEAAEARCVEQAAAKEAEVAAERAVAEAKRLAEQAAKEAAAARAREAKAAEEAAEARRAEDQSLEKFFKENPDCKGYNWSVGEGRGSSKLKIKQRNVDTAVKELREDKRSEPAVLAKLEALKRDIDWAQGIVTARRAEQQQGREPKVIVRATVREGLGR